MKYIISLSALIAGVLLSVLGNFIGNRKLEKSGSSGLSMASMLRQFISIGYLFALFFILRAIEADMAMPLVCGALGVTVPSLIIAFRMAKKIKTAKTDDKDSADKEKAKEGEQLWKDQK